MDPWSTHLPLLRTLGKGVRRVLELGAGRYSTPCFLDRVYYPELIYLLSIEHDEDWAKQVREHIGSDPRHVIRVVPEPIEQYLPDLANFDLILVDNSDKAERRVETIKYISTSDTGFAKVVFHDVERDDYRMAVSGFKNQIIDQANSPWTMVCWR